MALSWIKTEDSSYTYFSNEFNEHHHSTKEGAFTESLNKHVIPAFSHIGDRDEITILDICFGLGFNTFTTLHYLKNSNKKITIHSPELDEDLVHSLVGFPYPKPFKSIEKIIKSVVQTGEYHSDTINIKIYFEDARAMLERTDKLYDIVFQDAFSPNKNRQLWTREYFKELKKHMHGKSILTTYSSATSARMGLYENGFNIFLNEIEGLRTGTLASLGSIDAKSVDMELKKIRNTEAKSLRDAP